MVQHTLIRHAARARLKTLSVCTTGSTTLSATATGYARASGSFLTDGFCAGMEVAPDGFTQTAVGLITAVSALTLTISGGRTVQAAGSGRTLAVGLPTLRGWENIAIDPAAEVPYVLEQYLPGGSSKQTLGSLGEVEAVPVYAAQFHAMHNVGADALSRYADAVCAHFAVGTTLTLTNGDIARVRGDVGPAVSPLFIDGDRASVTVSVSLRLRSPNSL